MTIKRRIEIETWQHSFESLPAGIKNIFSASEEVAYRSGADFFIGLAAQSEATPIQQLLGELSSNHPMFVEMCSDNGSDWKIWFGFSLVRKEYHPRIRLAKPELSLPPTAPDDVQAFYRTFGGFCESSFVGGFMTTEDVIRDASDFVMDHHEISSVGCHFMFDYGNGDYAGWNSNGDGVMYDHERGTLTPCSFPELYQTWFDGMEKDRFSDAFGELD